MQEIKMEKIENNSFRKPVTTISKDLSRSSTSIDNALVPNHIFGNDVILRHLFSVVPLKDLKTYRQVCSNWRNLSEKEFKKRSVLKFDFRRTQSVFNVVNHEAFSQQAESMFKTFNAIQNGCPEIPRDSFFFAGPIAWENLFLRDFFRQYGKQIKYLCLELRISSPVDLITLQTIISEYLPNVKHLAITWAAETQFIIQRLLEYYPGVQHRSLLKKRLEENLRMPNALKVLSIRMLDGNLEGRYFRAIEGNVLQLFNNLIANANCLQELDISDSFQLDVEKLSPSFIANLREIRFKMLGKPCCSKLTVLMKLSSRCPRLDSLSIEYSKLSTMFIDLDPLLEILYSVKGRLNKLRIYWEPSVDYESPIDEIFSGDKKILEFPKMESLEVLDISYNLLSHNAMYFGTHDWVKQFPALKTLKCRYNVQKCVGVEHPFVLSLPSFLDTNETVTSLIFDCSQTVTLWKNYLPLEIKNLENYFKIAQLKFTNLESLTIIEQEDGMFKYSVHSYSRKTKDHCSYLVDFKYYNRYLKCK